MINPSNGQPSNSVERAFHDARISIADRTAPSDPLFWAIVVAQNSRYQKMKLPVVGYDEDGLLIAPVPAVGAVPGYLGYFRPDHLQTFQNPECLDEECAYF
jgi:hypothetical protein